MTCFFANYLKVILIAWFTQSQTTKAIAAILRMFPKHVLHLGRSQKSCHLTSKHIS